MADDACHRWRTAAGAVGLVFALAHVGEVELQQPVAPGQLQGGAEEGH